MKIVSKAMKIVLFVGVLVVLMVQLPSKLFSYVVTRDIDQQGKFNIQISEDKNVFEYYKSKLSNEEKLYYDELKEAFNNFQRTMYTKQSNITVDQSVKVYNALHYDHPEMFWTQAIKTSYYRGSKIINRRIPIILYYNFSEEEVLKYKESMEKMTSQIVEEANKLNTDEEKAKFVHDKLILMTEYETEKDYSLPYYQSLASLFNEGKAVCAGYAYAYKHIMDELNIDTIIILGKGIGQDHAWNRVKLDDKWQNVDVTWDDYGSIMVGSSYFLLEDEIFNMTHVANLEL